MTDRRKKNCLLEIDSSNILFDTENATSFKTGNINEILANNVLMKVNPGNNSVQICCSHSIFVRLLFTNSRRS